MIKAQTYTEHGAMAVLSKVDPQDLIEAQTLQGRSLNHLALFAHWHAIQPHTVFSVVLYETRTSQPFAVLVLIGTGLPGIVQAAFLARNHRRHRRALVATCRRIRTEMPGFCRDNGIHRVEARAYAQHPRASKFLTACGFAHEADMPGFGPDGRATFRQFAWTNPDLSKGD